MTSISLLTPLDTRRGKWLADLGADVDALRSRVTTDIEWVVCVDGTGAQTMPDAVSYTLRLPMPGGPAAARTAALAASSGEWVLPIDADDHLDVSGTTALIAELDAIRDAGVGWVGASRRLVTGAATAHTVTERQRWPPGTLAERWTAPFPFHPNSVVVDRSVASACGGWPALPTNEDLAFVLAVSEATMGMTMEHVITLYRIWDGQTVTNRDYDAAKHIAFATIAALHSARRAAVGRPPITAPASAGGAHGRIAR